MNNEPKANKGEIIANQLRVRRIIQVLISTIVALASLAVHQLYFGNWFSVVTLLAVIGIITPIFGLVRKKRLDLSISLLLWLLTITASIFMWRYKGLADETLFAYPGILIFAFIIGNRMLPLYLLIFMSINILTIGVANSFGFYINEVSNSALESAVLLLILLLLISFSVWIVSKDFNTIIDKLTKENIRFAHSQSEIEKLLHHDALTNLPNRVLARDRFEHALAQARRDSTLVCIMFIDLDNFKNVNDSLGHTAGDQFLKLLSKSLVKTIRETDSVCRLGGDEFLIILESITDKNEILAIAEKIIEQIKAPITIQGNSILITCSIGIAITPQDGNSFDTISRHADMALYQAKETGKNNYRFYNQQMNINAKYNITLISDLQDAIAKNQMHLVYQPKIDLLNKKIIGVEALLRWIHPVEGYIPPDKFIPLAESSGQIIKIGSWVISQACKDCKSWTSEKYPDISVAVNVSSLQFKNGDILTDVLHTLGEVQLDGHLLELELTESLLIDETGTLKHCLAELRKAGVKFSIDDFGTGYSNLGYLKSFEVETLKIDQSFIRRVEKSPQDQALVKAIVQMASSLNMKTVAEGIETTEIMKICKEFNCDSGQGYLWSRPLPYDEFIDFLDNYEQTSY